MNTYSCIDCGEPDPCYKLRDDVWFEAFPDYHEVRKARAAKAQKGAPGRFDRFTGLCFDCLSKRLGRPLVIEDFSNSIINDGIRFGYSMGQSISFGR